MTTGVGNKSAQRSERVGVAPEGTTGTTPPAPTIAAEPVNAVTDGDSEKELLDVFEGGDLEPCLRDRLELLPDFESLFPPLEELLDEEDRSLLELLLLRERSEE